MKLSYLKLIIMIALLAGCGGSGGGSSSPQTSALTGVFMDAPVVGLDYATSSGISGSTNSNGEFQYQAGDNVMFKIGTITIGSAIGSSVITPLNVVGTSDANDSRVITILRTLQSMDVNNGTGSVIQISQTAKTAAQNATTIDLSKATFISDDDFQNKTGIKLTVSKTDAVNNFARNTQNAGKTSPTIPTTGQYSLIAWNDLGMHCIDGTDYSIFSILPPYNNLKAQLVNRANPSLVINSVTITYEATADENGSVNSTSSGKTNFWNYAASMYKWMFKTANQLLTNVGLVNENPAPNSTPAPMIYNNVNAQWEADGIPITPYDDKGVKNYYPMVKVVAKDAKGMTLASTRVVLPVSDEMSCVSCHASTSGYNAAKPKAGWVNNSNVLKDWKLNILRLHDEKIPTAVSANSAALSAKGFNYQASLEATASAGTPILCASCHLSNALPGSGIANVKPLTQDLHAKHASVTDPTTNQTLDSSTNRSACYTCHPGSTTKCLRGAMGNAVNADGSAQMNCQSCHGSISAVGSGARAGWLDEPSCQNCHDKSSSNGAFTRFTSVFSGGSTLRATLDGKFATNSNVPASGKSLYRFSKGHGNVSCEACHGSTHAEYPSSHANDNAQSIALQGHSGTVAECSVCHSSKFASMTLSGPHGMHPIGQQAVDLHKSYANKNGTSSCTVCHGADYRGTPLSATSQARTLTVENGSKTFAAKKQIGCYDCHNGPNP